MRLLGSSTSGDSLWDATCGLGADSLAAFDEGVEVVSSDLDAFTCWCARNNLLEAGAPGKVLRVDGTSRAVKAGWLLLDPDRRVLAGRSHRGEEWSPTLERATACLSRVKGGCIKLPPGIDPTRIESGGEALVWTSLAGELKEVGLYRGVERLEAGTRHAHALTRDGREAWFTGAPESCEAWNPEEAREVSWLAEPDPSLIRSGLLEAHAVLHGLRPLASQLAWLGGHAAPTSPFLRARPVLGSCPVDRKQVRALLGEHGIGPIEVWKRGHPDPVELLARKFRGPGTIRGTLAIGRLDQGHRAWLLGPPREMVGDEGLEPTTRSV